MVYGSKFSLKLLVYCLTYNMKLLTKPVAMDQKHVLISPAACSGVVHSTQKNYFDFRISISFCNSSTFAFSS